MTSTQSGRNAPGLLKKRCIASIKIEKHKAKRKTPFTNAARISARCHPYEYFVSDPATRCFAVSCRQNSVHNMPRFNDSTDPDSVESDDQAQNITLHRISRRKRML